MDAGGVVALAAARVQYRDLRTGVFQRQGAQSVPQGGIVALGEELIAGSYHALVVSGGLGVFFVGGEQVDIALLGHIKAVAVGAGIGALFPMQGGGAEGTGKQAQKGHLLPNNLSVSYQFAGDKTRAALVRGPLL